MQTCLGWRLWRLQARLMKLGRDCIRDWGSRGASQGLWAPLRYLHTWICPFPIICALHFAQYGFQIEDLMAPTFSMAAMELP